MDDSYLEWFYIYLKGFVMGAADAVPGISGGTIALITGIYERLISAITAVNFETILGVVRGIRPPKFQKAVDAFSKIDGFFLLVLGSGVLTAVVMVLNIIHHLLSNYPISTFGFFWGLIAVSGLVLSRKIDLTISGTKPAALIGFLIAFVVSGFAGSSLAHSLPVVFIAGVFSVSAMILPGISGSLILVILGQYEYMSGALSRFTDALFATISSGDTISLIDSFRPVAVFILGGFVGIFTVAHFIRWALENYRKITFAFLVSLVFGALRAPILEVEKSACRK